MNIAPVRRAQSAAVAPARIVSSWTTWSSRWPTMNRPASAATVISPRVGWSPRRARSAGGQRPPAPVEPAERVVDPVVQLARRERPVALDEPDAHRVGRDPAERHGLRLAVEDPLDLAEPVRAPSRRDGRAPRPAPSGPRPSRRRPRPSARVRRPPPPGGWPPARPGPPASRVEQLSSMCASVARRA